jgi:peroxiredoxin
MTIKIADRLPNGQIQEFVEVESAGCSLGPNRFDVDKLVKGKTIVVFGVPGAFTPTCSAQHVPGFLRHYDELRSKGIDEIWCFSVNDAFVMGAWGRDQKTASKIRMMADGSGEYTAKLGLEYDLRAGGLGVRCQRFSMLVQDGVVKKLNIETPGKFEASSAEAMLRQLA